ncbi:MAG: CotH kinase family protein [Nitrospira sp.]|nr:CotH kinase family protein [Nitrospira sp.]
MNQLFLSRNRSPLGLTGPPLWHGVAAFWISSRLVTAALVAVVACSGTTFAADRTGPIAVLDFELRGTPIQTLDDNDVEVKGTLRVFKNHTTPLLPDSNLDLDKLRADIPAPAVDIDIKRRGSSSKYHPKKSYSLDFKIPVKLLGMPLEQEWVLHSCWADKTCLRNVIGYWQAKKLFSWAPRTEFAEVFINGQYRGLYVVVEKVKLSPSRVKLPPPTDNAFNGEITGTYILKRDGDDRDFDWKSSLDPLCIHPPKLHCLRWWFVSPKRTLTEVQKDYIKHYMDVSFESKFFPPSVSYDPYEYDEWMDERSAVDFVIIQEIANNVDAYWKSMHITKQRLYPGNDLIHMGPIWDLDLAFSNYNDPEVEAHEQLCATDSWRMEKAGHFQPLREMWKVPQFRRAIYDRWRALRIDGSVSRSRIDRKIDDSAARIEAARTRDNAKWKTLGRKTWVECWNRDEYRLEIGELKKWIRARITWMDQQILGDWRFRNP